MFLQVAAHVIEQYCSRWDVIVTALLFFSLISWRTWKFTIAPILYPSRVRELPYWIPGLGHTVSFFLNAPVVVDAGMYDFLTSPSTYRSLLTIADA
jgi:hypothetical protein